MKEKEAELKAAEQRLHDEFEHLRSKNQEEKRLQDDKKRQLVSEDSTGVEIQFSSKII